MAAFTFRKKNYDIKKFSKADETIFVRISKIEHLIDKNTARFQL